MPGRSRPEQSGAKLGANACGSTQPAVDAAGHHTPADQAGSDSTGRVWTPFDHLRIRRLGVRVPPSAPHECAGQRRAPAQVGRLTDPEALPVGAMFGSQRRPSVARSEGRATRDGRLGRGRGQASCAEALGRGRGSASIRDVDGAGEGDVLVGARRDQATGWRSDRRWSWYSRHTSQVTNMSKMVRAIMPRVGATAIR